VTWCYNSAMQEKYETLSHDPLREINLLIGGGKQANYTVNRFVLHEGSDREHPSARELSEKLSGLWWISVMENEAIQMKLQSYLRAQYVPLRVNPAERQKALAALPNMLRDFFVVSELRDQSRSEGTSPQDRIASLRKSTAFIDPDTIGRFSYDIKAKLNDRIGYASLNWGLYPEKTASMLGYSLKELSQKIVVMAGAGGGDLAIRSFPKGTKVCAIDYSEGMVNIAKERGLVAFQGDVSDRAAWDLPSPFNQPDIVVADYFLDVSQRPTDAIRLMSEKIALGGHLMIINLLPIDQRYGYPDETQNIGNTGNPWSDLRKIEEVCARYGLKPKNFSITSYLQYDIGRQEDMLPLEIRPSGLLVFEKV
jgi:2-polyprenyl-3-methyl-5-hydroxy-6-metoxy-1,4-benzoquinol methylase